MARSIKDLEALSGVVEKQSSAGAMKKDLPKDYKNGKGRTLSRKEMEAIAAEMGYKMVKENLDEMKDSIEVAYQGDKSDAKDDAQQFKVKIELDKGRAYVSGDKKNIIKFLTRRNSFMDKKDVQDEFPELFEAKLDLERVKKGILHAIKKNDMKTVAKVAKEVLKDGGQAAFDEIIDFVGENS